MQLCEPFISFLLTNSSDNRVWKPSAVHMLTISFSSFLYSRVDEPSKNIPINHPNDHDNEMIKSI